MRLQHLAAVGHRGDVLRRNMLARPVECDFCSSGANYASFQETSSERHITVRCCVFVCVCGSRHEKIKKKGSSPKKMLRKRWMKQKTVLALSCFSCISRVVTARDRAVHVSRTVNRDLQCDFYKQPRSVWTSLPAAAVP